MSDGNPADQLRESTLLQLRDLEVRLRHAALICDIKTWDETAHDVLKLMDALHRMPSELKQHMDGLTAADQAQGDRLEHQHGALTGRLDDMAGQLKAITRALQDHATALQRIEATSNRSLWARLWRRNNG